MEEKATISAWYSQEVKVIDPRGGDYKWQNVKFNEGFSLSEPFSDPPEDPEDLPLWEEQRLERMRYLRNQIKNEVEADLQQELDDYYAQFEEEEEDE